MQRLTKHFLAAALAVPLASACVTNPDGTMRLDDRATGALLGAAAGCGIASLAGSTKDCAKGAVVGALAGFLIGWHFESKKVASATEVNRQYAKKQKLPKKEIQPVAFDTEVKQTTEGADGQRSVEITSNTDLVGYGDKAPQMQQRYAIYDENDKLVETKTENIAVDGAGRYETKSTFKLPADAKDKQYKVESALIANGKEVKANKYTISYLGDGPLLAAN